MKDAKLRGVMDMLDGFKLTTLKSILAEKLHEKIIDQQYAPDAFEKEFQFAVEWATEREEEANEKTSGAMDIGQIGGASDWHWNSHTIVFTGL